MKMNARFVSLFAVLIAITPLLSAGEVEQLRALVAEQEKQIQQLELKVSQLTITPTTTTSSPTIAAESSPAPAPIESSSELIPLEPPSAEDSPIYIIKAGDNMVAIARKHGTTSAILNKLNGLKPDGIIHPGQKIKLPTATATATATASEATLTPTAATPTKTVKHTVASNETYYSISRKYSVSVDDLTKANPSINPRALRIGQTIQIPTKEEISTETAALESDENPTLSGNNNIPVSTQPRASDKPIRITKEISYSDFAKTYNTSTSRLNQLNGLRLDPNTVLAQGSELYVPK
jgi:LysM repeat protein